MSGKQNLGQGKPQAKDSSGGGASWYLGVISQPTTANHAAVESRLFFEGTVTATDMDRATDTREKGRIGITGSAQSYGGSNGRVTSEAIGRDINPLGRGGGAALVGGIVNLGNIAPRLPKSSGEANQGNSVNNGCAGCGPGSPYDGDREDDYDDWYHGPIAFDSYNKACIEEWKRAIDRNGGPNQCKYFHYCQNCACLPPGGKAWYEYPEGAVKDYCDCVVRQDCKCEVGWAGDPGVHCQPPAHCIRCSGNHKPGGPGRCPRNCQNNIDIFKRFIDPEGPSGCAFMSNIMTAIELDVLGLIWEAVGLPDGFSLIDPCMWCQAKEDIGNFAQKCKAICWAVEQLPSITDLPWWADIAKCQSCCEGLFNAATLVSADPECCVDACCNQ